LAPWSLIPDMSARRRFARRRSVLARSS